MRWHLRLIALCIVAALAAGCSNSDRPSEPTTSNDNRPLLADLPPNTACMGDTIWSDTNCNGVQDEGEPGLGGITVKLYECPSGTLVDETVSEATGYYALFGPAPDDYYIVVELPEGCRFSPKDVGQPQGVRDIGTDSDVDENGVGFCTNLSDQEIEKAMDAGICCPEEPCTADVGDLVWYDTNCNGIQDSGEPGASGVSVTLYTCAGGVVGTTTTNGSGNYLFTDVPDGSYKVCIDIPAGYDASLKNQGAVEGTDSDINADGCTDCFTIADCKDNLLVDGGLCQEECTADVGDLVWYDSNCNGIQDSGEGGASGVTVKLYTCAGQLLGTDVTDGSGNYLFTGISDGSYYVCFTLPAGYVFAPKNQGGVEATDSDANSGGCTDCFTIADCKDNLLVDAGLCRLIEGEGCTPGFWKNHLTHWGPTGYTPDMIFDDVFGCEIFGDNTTLYEAASPEITHNTLAAHGVAALLNASHPGVDFSLTAGEVFDAVCSGDKDTLSDANERQCPLSGGNTNKKNGPNSQQRR